MAERKARTEARRKFEEENAPEPYTDEARLARVHAARRRAHTPRARSTARTRAACAAPLSRPLAACTTSASLRRCR